MEDYIYVQTGEVKIGGGNSGLKSSPVGSCVIVIMFNENVKKGGMAHIMLPGKAPEKRESDKCKYAINAIDTLLALLKNDGMDCNHLKAVVAGGGNVLKRSGDTIGTDNLSSVFNHLKFKKITILKKSVGGTNRKSVWFDISEQTVYYTEGDSKEKILYKI